VEKNPAKFAFYFKELFVRPDNWINIISVWIIRLKIFISYILVWFSLKLQIFHLNLNLIPWSPNLVPRVKHGFAISIITKNKKFHVFFPNLFTCSGRNSNQTRSSAVQYINIESYTLLFNPHPLVEDLFPVQNPPFLINCITL